MSLFSSPLLCNVDESDPGGCCLQTNAELETRVQGPRAITERKSTLLPFSLNGAQSSSQCWLSTSSPTARKRPCCSHRSTDGSWGHHRPPTAKKDLWMLSEKARAPFFHTRKIDKSNFDYHARPGAPSPWLGWGNGVAEPDGANKMNQPINLT